MVILYLIEKEFKQMFRNIILPIVFVLLPLAIINVVPRLATQEVKNLKFCTIDNDHSTLSSRMIQKINASKYFTLHAIVSNYENAMDVLERGDADFIVEIQPDFEKALIAENKSRVLLSVNAVDGSKAGLGANYLTQIINSYAEQLRNEAGFNNTSRSSVIPSLELSTRYIDNATLDYKRFMIPGIIGLLLILLVGFLPALNIVGEKEKGTIEQMNVTPIGRFDFILSKLIPYWVVGLIIDIYAVMVGIVMHDIAPVGSWGLLILFGTMFILVVSSIGLIVSNYSDTTQQASLVMFFFLVIFILLSGLLTPIASMPEWARFITYFNPLRYFVEAMRAIYLKGSSFSELLPQFKGLMFFIALMWTWAIASYKKNN